MLSVLLASFLSSSAFAADWYLEGPDRDQKADATAMEEAAVQAGHEARVVRRFVDGEGWRFFVRVEGFADPASARTAARDLADGVGVAFGVFETDGRTAARVEVIQPKGAPAAAAEAPTADATPVLEAMIEALGSDESVLRAVRGGPVRFEFDRELPDGRVVGHTWAARGDALYLEIRAVAGAVKPSRTVVNARGAWLSVDGGPWVAQDAEKTRELLEHLGPDEILPLVMSLAVAVETRREFERMGLVGEGDDEGVPVQVLRFEGDATSGPLEIEIGLRDHLLRRVRFDEGEVEHVYEGWRRFGKLQIPERLTSHRGGAMTDAVEIRALDLAPNLPDAWFADPTR